MTRQKLELTWIGKDQRPRLEPRILLEDPARSYHAKPWNYLLIPHEQVTEDKGIADYFRFERSAPTA